MFSTKKVSVWLVALAALAVVTAPVANGQDVTTGSATATVLTVLAVTATNALDFGNVYQGVAKTQDETDNALSGIFTITGSTAAGISCYLQLPDYMALSTGVDRMTIAFSATDATISVLAAGTPAVPGVGAVPNVDPHNLPATVIGDGTSQIFLGGKVIPSVNQTAGAYSADIVLTVAYTGV
jgi:hypothetical protein